METYNGDSPAQWQAYFDYLVDNTPLSSVGMGVGTWDDTKNGWWETEAGAQYKVAAAIGAKVPEIAAFRLLPTQQPFPWPNDFWWAALRRFRQAV